MNFELATKEYLTTLVRHAVTSLGAVLVAKGLVPSSVIFAIADSTASAIVGGVVMLAGYLWSLASKRKALDTKVSWK